MNRNNRDTILNRALDMIDSGALNAKDRPAGTILPTAISIGWLQEAIDYFQNRFPHQAILFRENIALAQGSSEILLPTDYILDYPDGILWNKDTVGDGRGGRCRRASLSYIIEHWNGTPTIPARYTVRANMIRFNAPADRALSASFYYYQLQAVLAAGTVPIFPDDSILTDYVRLRGLEWHRSVEPGTSMAYMVARVAELRLEGVGQEAEEDTIHFDSDYITPSAGGRNDWMG